MNILDLSHFNNPKWTGLAVFLGVLGGLIAIYSLIYTDNDKENQRVYLINKLQSFSSIPLELLGKQSAIYFTLLFEKFFGKPDNYTLRDPKFWNIRSSLFFIVMALVIILYNFHTFKGNYLDYYPVFIFILPFIANCIFGHKLRIAKLDYEIYNLENQKIKKLRSSIKKLKTKRKQLSKPRNYTFCLLFQSR